MAKAAKDGRPPVRPCLNVQGASPASAAQSERREDGVHDPIHLPGNGWQNAAPRHPTRQHRQRCLGGYSLSVKGE